MQKHFQKTISIVCLLALMLCFPLIMTCCHRDFNSNRNAIHYSDIEKIHIGMPLDSVILVLGLPYAFGTDLGDHDLTCKNSRVVSDINMTKGMDIVHCIDSIYQDTNYCCEANRKNMMNIKKHTTLTYTKPLNNLKTYPMLWVHLDGDYRVSSVYAKYYGIIDDKSIYSLSPSVEFSDRDSIDNPINLFMDTTLFRKCFPN